MNDENPIALEAFEKLAERFAAIAESKPENAYIEQPCIRNLIGEVRGCKVLDAGCGPGILAKHLSGQGAFVTGFDISPQMIRFARDRLSDQGEFHVADLGRPLEFAKADSFDLVVSSLAIDYVRDWRIPLREFSRVLKKRGRLVFSVQHPLGSFNWYKPPTAFGIQRVKAIWKGFGGEPVSVPDYYRSFEEMMNPILDSDFDLVRIIETKPIAALEQIDPAAFEKFSRQPTFLCFDLRKDQ